MKPICDSKTDPASKYFLLKWLHHVSNEKDTLHIEYPNSRYHLHSL